MERENARLRNDKSIAEVDRDALEIANADAIAKSRKQTNKQALPHLNNLPLLPAL